jgi:hypothetical protein
MSLPASRSGFRVDLITMRAARRHRQIQLGGDIILILNNSATADEYRAASARNRKELD